MFTVLCTVYRDQARVDWLYAVNTGHYHACNTRMFVAIHYTVSELHWGTKWRPTPAIGPDTCSNRMSRAKQLRRHLPFLLDILTVCPQCSMSSYPNFPNIFPQDSHVDLKQCPTKTFCIQYIIQEFSSLSLV